MGHQVNFYATPEDVAQLQQRIGEIEPMHIIHSRAPTARPQVLSSLNYIEAEEPLLFYYLVRQQDLSRLATEHVASQGYWSVDVITAPAIKFSSCFFDGEILRRDRAYYTDGCYDESGEWVIKPESFRVWAKNVIKVMKKSLKRHGSDYIGIMASKWLAEEDGKLVT